MCQTRLTRILLTIALIKNSIYSKEVPESKPKLSIKDAKPSSGSGDGPEDEDYDPYEHREVSHPTTNFDTLVHLLKAIIGTGILAMPDAFKNAGLIVGSVGTIIIGAICTYCIHILMRSQYFLCKKMKVPIMSYPESMKLALAEGPDCLKCCIPAAGLFVDVFIAAYQFGICCVYVVFTSESLKQLVAYYWIDISVRIWMVILLLPLIAISMIKNLKHLVPFSEVANVITLAALGIVLYYVFTDWPSPTSVPFVGELNTLALFFGTILFALEPIGVINALENNMKHPEAFRGYFGVLNQGMIIVTLLYLFMGFVGYVKYQERVKGSITLNIPQKDILAQCVVVAFLVAIYLSYALQYYVPVRIVWNSWVKQHVPEGREVCMEYVLRVVVVILTFLSAQAIPMLGLFITLVGCLCLPLIGIAAPCLMELCLHWRDKDYGFLKYILVQDIFFIIFGICSTIISVTTTVIAIVEEQKKPK